MLSVSRASRGLAALLLVASSHALSAADLPDVVDELEAWLDENSDLPRRAVPPSIRLVPSSLAESEYGSAGRMGGRLRAFYDDKTETVTLVEPWHLQNTADQSVLLHELVHHRQAPLFAYCEGAKELPAYRLQAAWLAERGGEANINWIAAVLESGCTPKDIHPE